MSDGLRGINPQIEIHRADEAQGLSRADQAAQAVRERTLLGFKVDPDAPITGILQHAKPQIISLGTKLAVSHVLGHRPDGILAMSKADFYARVDGVFKRLAARIVGFFAEIIMKFAFARIERLAQSAEGINREEIWNDIAEPTKGLARFVRDALEKYQTAPKDHPILDQLVAKYDGPKEKLLTFVQETIIAYRAREELTQSFFEFLTTERKSEIQQWLPSYQGTDEEFVSYLIKIEEGEMIATNFQEYLSLELEDDLGTALFQFNDPLNRLVSHIVNVVVPKPLHKRVLKMIGQIELEDLAESLRPSTEETEPNPALDELIRVGKEVAGQMLVALSEDASAQRLVELAQPLIRPIGAYAGSVAGDEEFVPYLVEQMVSDALTNHVRRAKEGVELLENIDYMKIVEEAVSEINEYFNLLHQAHRIGADLKLPAEEVMEGLLRDSKESGFLRQLYDQIPSEIKEIIDELRIPALLVDITESGTLNQAIYQATPTLQGIGEILSQESEAVDLTRAEAIAPSDALVDDIASTIVNLIRVVRLRAGIKDDDFVVRGAAADIVSEIPLIRYAAGILRKFDVSETDIYALIQDPTMKRVIAEQLVNAAQGITIKGLIGQIGQTLQAPAAEVSEAAQEYHRADFEKALVEEALPDIIDFGIRAAGAANYQVDGHTAIHQFLRIARELETVREIVGDGDGEAAWDRLDDISKRYTNLKTHLSKEDVRLALESTGRAKEFHRLQQEFEYALGEWIHLEDALVTETEAIYPMLPDLVEVPASLYSGPSLLARAKEAIVPRAADKLGIKQIVLQPILDQLVPTALEMLQSPAQQRLFVRGLFS